MFSLLLVDIATLQFSKPTKPKITNGIIKLGGESVVSSESVWGVSEWCQKVRGISVGGRAKQCCGQCPASDQSHLSSPPQMLLSAFSKPPTWICGQSWPNCLIPFILSLGLARFAPGFTDFSIRQQKCDLDGLARVWCGEVSVGVPLSSSSDQTLKRERRPPI